MKKEKRTVVYDESLRIEACRFEGIVQPFPNHFHEHYVIGFVENGERCLSCRNTDYMAGQGSIVLFNPGDNHACVQSDNGTLDYRSFNISKEIMLDLAEEVTGKRELPGFSKNVIYDDEVICCLRPLHEMVMNGNSGFGKEENFLFLLSSLIKNYSQPFKSCIPECRQEIEKACTFMEQHFTEHIYLDQICYQTGLSKSTLLRAFTKSKGITPYRYLETIRINKAKKLLSNGISLLDTAIRTGFFDQSHFTNYFTSFTGLAPGVYREIFLEKIRAVNRSGWKAHRAFSSPAHNHYMGNYFYFHKNLTYRLPARGNLIFPFYYGLFDFDNNISAPYKEIKLETGNGLCYCGLLRGMFVLFAGKCCINLYNGFQRRRNYIRSPVYYRNIGAPVYKNRRKITDKFFCWLYCCNGRNYID